MLPETSAEDSRDLVASLIRDGRLNLPGAFVAPDSWPNFPVMHADRDRWRGMMLGLAIGDALGNTSEGLLPAERRRTHGEVRDYLPNRHSGWNAVGLPSDDTQLAFWTLEQWISDGRLDPERLAELFANRPIFGIGSSVRSFVGAHRAGRPWPEASSRSAGNGALMRIAAVVVPHIGGHGADLWGDAILGGAVTHNDPASISACAAFACMLAELLSMNRAPAPEWWVNRYIELARPIEGDTSYAPRSGQPRDFKGTLSAFVERCVPVAHRLGLDTCTACNTWHSGAYLLETVPSALYILTCFADDPEEAIVRAVNDTRDNDTTAAIVGAAVGALHGEAALPARWRKGLLGRTMHDDDGRIFELLEQAELELVGNAPPPA
jgi:ADP-ribosylglycohydrolase